MRTGVALNMTPLEEAADLRSRYAGKKIVLAHGVWDGLHVGHMKHLELARAKGDVLVVGVTADQYVRKGPGRPVLDQDARMEALRAVRWVDHVILSDAPTAEALVDALKPDLFVKGTDTDPQWKGRLPGSYSEARAIQAAGGLVDYTNTMYASSGALLAEYGYNYPPKTRAWLNQFRHDHTWKEVDDAINTLSSLHVLVVGEIIHDVYTHIEPLAKSFRSNYISVLQQDAHTYLGGAHAIGVNLTPFVKRVSVLGQDAEITKTRFLLPSGITLFGVQSIPMSIAEEHHEYPDLEKYDAVLVIDYGHGLFTPASIAQIEARASWLAVNVQSNSANFGRNLYHKWHRADYRTMDTEEAALGSQSCAVGTSRLTGAGIGIAPLTTYTITEGVNGSTLYCKDPRDTCWAPALAPVVVDRTGAGDVLFAFTALLVRAGVNPQIVAFLGAAAAGLQCGVEGHATPITPAILRRFCKALMRVW